MECPYDKLTQKQKKSIFDYVDTYWHYNKENLLLNFRHGKISPFRLHCALCLMGSESGDVENNRIPTSHHYFGEISLNHKLIEAYFEIEPYVIGQHLELKKEGKADEKGSKCGIYEQRKALLLGLRKVLALLEVLQVP